MYEYDREKFEYRAVTWYGRNKGTIKLIPVWLMIILLAILTDRYMNRTREKEVIVKTSTIIVPQSGDSIPSMHDELVDALIFVESSGRDSIINPTSGATGCLQLLPIMVKEVNRILKIADSEHRYTLADRYSRRKSIEMFHIWRLFHHSNSSYEKIARNWNGGPNGYLMPSTLGYWRKVKRRL